MPIHQRYRSADSPLVERVTHVVYDDAAGGVTLPDGCWDLVFRRRRGVTQILQTGIITRPIPLDYEPDDEYLSVSFRPGVFMPGLRGARMLNHAFFRPAAGRRAFWLDGQALEIPTFENTEGLVSRLVRRGLLARDPVVTGALHEEGRTPAARASRRTAQRHFRSVLGITPKTLQQIYRAHAAMERLQRGGTIIDVALDLGFADQAHLTRSLKALTGQTPGEIARAAAAAQAARAYPLMAHDLSDGAR